MIKFKMVCPECQAAVIAASPQALIWELCFECRLHIWDLSDVQMADMVHDYTFFGKAEAGLEMC